MDVKPLALSIAFGVGVTVMAVAVLFVSMLEWLGDILLMPGTIVPRWYWGGIHDPLQWLAAFGLNVLFYASIALIAMALRKQDRRE